MHLATPALTSLDEVQRGLAALGLTAERGRGQRMLQGSLECPGEPVDLRLPAGTMDAVEDFGFVEHADGLRLVCGELDEAVLERQLLAPLRAAVAELRVTGAAEQAGLTVETTTESDGRRRLVLRRTD